MATTRRGGGNRTGSFTNAEAEVAARRIIAGHIDTADLDPITARAVEILVAADLLMAADSIRERTFPGNRARVEDRTEHNLWYRITLVAAMLSLMLMSWGFLRVVNLADQSHATQAQNRQILDAINSCVNPKGDCAKRGATSQAKAVGQIIDALDREACHLAHPHDPRGEARCVVDAQRRMQQP